MNMNDAKTMYETTKRARAESLARVERIAGELGQVEQEIKQVTAQMEALDKAARRAIRDFAGGADRSSMHDAAAELAMARSQLQQLEVVHDNCAAVLAEERNASSELGSKLHEASQNYRLAIVNEVSHHAAHKIVSDMLDALSLRGIDANRSLSEQLGEIAQRAFQRIEVDKSDLARRCDKLMKQHALGQ